VTSSGFAIGTAYTNSNDSVVNNALCFCPGTLILTRHGEVRVEDLAIGDILITASGGHRPIKWIGRRRYDGRFIAGNHLMLPVRIAAEALGPDAPRRDLHVSPGHGLYLDGMLVPAWRLVNGVSVTQAAQVDGVTYLHIELDAHDVLLAEGAPAESFLDEQGRGQFENAHEFDRLYPNAAAPLAKLPRLEYGFALQMIQERIAARAGVIAPVEPIGPLRGFVDAATPGWVCGWAQDADSPEEPVALEISVGSVAVLTVLANAFRADLRKAGLGSGCHAFAASLPSGFAGPVSVRRLADGSPLAQTDGAVPNAAPGPMPTARDAAPISAPASLAARQRKARSRTGRPSRGSSRTA
jgi:hypothetical protein